MFHKATFLAGLAAGYVLGARAGRERYETIKRQTDRLMSNPQVQQAATRVTHQAGDLAATAAHKVNDKVGDRLGDKLPFVHKHETVGAYGDPNGRRV